MRQSLCLPRPCCGAEVLKRRSSSVCCYRLRLTEKSKHALLSRIVAASYSPRRDWATHSFCRLKDDRRIIAHAVHVSVFVQWFPKIQIHSLATRRLCTWAFSEYWQQISPGAVLLSDAAVPTLFSQKGHKRRSISRTQLLPGASCAGQEVMHFTERKQQ